MRIMGLSLLNPAFPSPAGRFLLFTTKVMNRTFPSKIYLIFFLDTANLEQDLSYLFLRHCKLRDKSVFEKNSVVNEHGLNGLNG